MFEFHGWFVISETPDEYDVGGLERVIADLHTQIAQMKWPSGFADVKLLNGFYYLSIAGSPNRPRQYHQDLDKLLTFLADRAAGSYGLLYWRDDEDPSPPGNGNFHVRVLARGTVVDRFDPFLSPTVPIIESL